MIFEMAYFIFFSNFFYFSISNHGAVRGLFSFPGLKPRVIQISPFQGVRRITSNSGNNGGFSLFRFFILLFLFSTPLFQTTGRVSGFALSRG
jgi:flagellar biosynthesis protein FlhB